MPRLIIIESLWSLKPCNSRAGQRMNEYCDDMRSELWMRRPASKRLQPEVMLRCGQLFPAALSAALRSLDRSRSRHVPYREIEKGLHIRPAGHGRRPVSHNPYSCIPGHIGIMSMGGRWFGGHRMRSLAYIEECGSSPSDTPEATLSLARQHPGQITVNFEHQVRVLFITLL